MSAFGVETVELDLPPLVGAFARRLHDAGVPVTAERAARFAQALRLVRPVARRRLYWTARAVFVSDPTQVRIFNAVFAEVFGGARPPDALVLDDTHKAPSPGTPDERPVDDAADASSARGEADPWAADSSPAPMPGGDPSRPSGSCPSRRWPPTRR